MPCGRAIQLAMPTSPPIRKVMAASWKGGIVPVAAVSRARRDQRRTAVKPMAVAVRVVMRPA